MSNVAISDLPVATVINATDIIPFVQPAVAGTTKTITKTLLFTSPTMVTPVLGAATATTLGVTGVSTLTGGAVVQGMTVGLGGGAISNNTVVGFDALQSNVVAGNNTALGYNALYFTTAQNNTAVGHQAGFYNVSGMESVYIGKDAGFNDTDGSSTFIGYNAGFGKTTGDSTTIIGRNAGKAAGDHQSQTLIGDDAGLLTTGANNTFLGADSGRLITTGAKNTIIGAFDGNNGGLNILTASNYVVLSDGDGNPRAYWNGADATFNGSLAVSGITGTTAAATTIASAATIAPTKSITFISGTAAVVTITAIAPFTTGGGTITLIPTGVFTWTTAGNIALAGTAVVSRALTMTYDSTATKWYPSYV